jgi:hypothetical protein
MGSYSIRLYSQPNDSSTFDHFLSGQIRSRRGFVDRTRITNNI